MNGKLKSFPHHHRKMMGLEMLGLLGLLSVACQSSSETAELSGQSQSLSASSSPPSSPRPPTKAPPSVAAPTPPSIMFLLDTSESMQDFPQYLPEDYTPGLEPSPSRALQGKPGFIAPQGDFVNTGCTDPALVSAMSWFDKNSSDPAKNGSVIYDNDAFFGSGGTKTPFFEPDKFYNARGRRVAWQTEDANAALTPDFTALSAQSSTFSACYGSVGYDFNNFYFPSTALMDECARCLSTVGWWRGPRISDNTGKNADGSINSGAQQYTDSDYPPSRQTSRDGQAPPPPEAYRTWIVSGRVLNVRPPKFVVARKVLKDLINSASNVRLGVASFGKDRGWYDPPWVLAGMSPSCDKSYPNFDSPSLDRAQLTQAVNQTFFGHNERQTGESLFGLGGYFSSQRLDQKWANWFTQPVSPAYFGWPGCCTGGTYDEPAGTPGHTGAGWGMASDEWLKADTTNPVTGQNMPGQPWEDADYNKRSVCFADQKTAIIVVTGGAPRYDNTVPITKMMEILKANGARNPDGTFVQFDPTTPQTNPNVGGINYCDQVVKNPATGEKYTKADCDYADAAYNWPTGLGVGNRNFMDDTSFFLAHTDLRGDLAGDQVVRTYVVGYGDSSPMNQSIALAGRGQFFRADSGAQLQQALQQIVAGLQNPAQP